MTILIKVTSGNEVEQNSVLLNQILDLDKRNMLPIMDESGVTSFPWDDRVKGLTSSATTLIAAFYCGNLIGYIEFCPDWKDSNNIYLSSLQIEPGHRNGSTFRRLLSCVLCELKSKEFLLLTSNVQVSNTKMISIFEKFGFSVSRIDNKPTLTVSSDPSIFDHKLVKRLADLTKAGPR